MSKLNRRMSRRDLLRITILGASVILGGCGEMSKAEKKEIQDRRRSARRTRDAQQDLLRKVRKGYLGSPPSVDRSSRFRSTTTRSR